MGAILDNTPRAYSARDIRDNSPLERPRTIRAPLSYAKKRKGRARAANSLFFNCF